MTTNTLKQFQSLHYRRTLLEALAQLSCQLHGASEGLATVQQIIRPSHQVSAALRERLAKEIHFYNTQAEQKLRDNLVSLNSKLENACQLFLRIARLDDDAFIKNFQATDAHREKFRLLQHKVSDFQKQTHHYLAIRIVLQDRGLQLDSVKLALSHGVLDQELLAQELDGVKTREKLHKKRFRNEVVSMLTDTELLITVAKNNREVFAALMQSAGHLQSVLRILDSGGDIQLIPEMIENIHYELLPESAFVQESSVVTDTPIEQKKPDQKNPQEKKSQEKSPSPVAAPVKKAIANSFFSRFKIWISTSWGVTWEQTKYYPVDQTAPKEKPSARYKTSGKKTT